MGESVRTEYWLAEVARALQEQPERLFPYEDSRRLRTVLAKEFGQYDPEGMFNGDLNEHCSFIDGLASGGIKGHIKDAKQYNRLKFLLERTFFQRYPQYGFLKAVDLSPFPTLQEEIQVAERLRILLLKVLETAHGDAGHSKT